MSAMESSMSEDSDDTNSWRVNSSDSMQLSQATPRQQDLSKKESSLTAELAPYLTAANSSKYKSPTDRLPANSGGSSNPIPISRGGLASSRHIVESMETRLPLSPSDSVPLVNLRRSALLRSLQLRNQGVESAGQAVTGSSPLRESSREVCSTKKDGFQAQACTNDGPKVDLTKYVPLTHKDRAGFTAMDEERSRMKIKEQSPKNQDESME